MPTERRETRYWCAPREWGHNFQDELAEWVATLPGRVKAIRPTPWDSETLFAVCILDDEPVREPTGRVHTDQWGQPDHYPYESMGR